MNDNTKRAAQVEAVVQAMWKEQWAYFGMEPPYPFPSEPDDQPLVQERARQKAAAVVEALEPWSIDAMLASVHPTCRIYLMQYRPATRDYWLSIVWNDERGSQAAQGEGESWGTALIDAVQNAGGELNAPS